MNIEKELKNMKLNNSALIKPVFRLVGSKYKLLHWLFEKMELEKYSNFIDLFGGTGIVGINVKHLFSKMNVTINDYDHILKPFNFEHSILCQCKFNGFGTVTESSLKQFATKIQNGYFKDVKTYKEGLNKCSIIHQEAISFLSSYNLNENKTIIYIDIPYYDEKTKNSNLYINKLNINDFLDAIDNFIKLNKNITLAISINDSNKEVLNRLYYWKKHGKRISNSNMCHKKSSTEYLLIWNLNEN